MSQAKRTFQGKNFANLQENFSIKIKLDDQKENSNINNMESYQVDKDSKLESEDESQD